MHISSNTNDKSNTFCPILKRTIFVILCKTIFIMRTHLSLFKQKSQVPIRRYRVRYSPDSHLNQ